jgi:phosphatidylserine/phosphatidylglycerophosphate/cardiolipin synthase-like enzyme
MDQLLTDNVWKQVASLLKAKQKKVAAIAYVTTDAHLAFHKGDTLVCDASDNAIKCGETSAQTLKRLFETGVRLFSCPGLHAKSLVSDDLAIIGSSNLSVSSATSLIEASLVTRRFQARSQVRAFIHKLLPISSPIDSDFLVRALDLPVSVRPRGGAVRAWRIEPPTNKTWVVSTTPLSEQIKEREAEFRRPARRQRRSE